MRGKEISSRVNNEWATKIACAIENWLGKEDYVISKYIAQVTNTEGWFRVTDDPDFLNAMMIYTLQYLDV